ncbi:high-potential iron-sulfur protein [Ectothiorhodospira marina]|nr:high-potential iron-sulfur protein [Ectothiorhodospira marina]
MKMKQADLKRRNFLKLAASGVMAAPMAGLVSTVSAEDDALPHLKEDSADAQALNYRHDATQVDHADHEEGQQCGNCLLYTDPDAQEWGPCAVFPNHLVSEGGWCTAYVPRG